MELEQSSEVPVVEETSSCSFCGKAKKEVQLLVCGKSANICEQCTFSVLAAMREQDIMLPWSQFEQHLSAEILSGALRVAAKQMLHSAKGKKDVG